MDSTKPRLTVKTVLLPTVGLVAFFLYILLFNVDIPEILATAQRADPFLYSAAVAISLAEVFFYAVSWRALLDALYVKISIIRSYLFVWYGIFMDIVIPAESISGELCRVYLVNKQKCGTGGKAVASVVTQRILGMGMNIAFLIAGISLLLAETQVNPVIFNLILFFTVSIAAVLILLLLLSTREAWSLKAINGLIKVGEFFTRGKWKQLAKFKEMAIRDSKIFHDSMKEFVHKPKTLILPALLLAVNWMCSMSVPYLVFLSLGYPILWSVILITSAITVAVKSIPIGVPFEVGLPEITMTTLYTSMGVHPGIGATATILSRILTLWLRFGVGFAAQQWIELKAVLIPAENLSVEKT
jgi:uncharacterized protein (TIRG00374 family)